MTKEEAREILLAIRQDDDILVKEGNIACTSPWIRWPQELGFKDPVMVSLDRYFTPKQIEAMVVWMTA